jgi:hypothetical protein
MYGTKCDFSAFAERFRPGNNTRQTLLQRKGSGEATERKLGTRSLGYVFLKRVIRVEAPWNMHECAEHMNEWVRGDEGPEGGKDIGDWKNVKKTSLKKRKDNCRLTIPT